MRDEHAGEVLALGQADAVGTQHAKAAEFASALLLPRLEAIAGYLRRLAERVDTADHWTGVGWDLGMQAADGSNLVQVSKAEGVVPTCSPSCRRSWIRQSPRATAPPTCHGWSSCSGRPRRWGDGSWRAGALGIHGQCTVIAPAMLVLVTASHARPGNRSSWTRPARTIVAPRGSCRRRWPWWNLV